MKKRATRAAPVYDLCEALEERNDVAGMFVGRVRRLAEAFESIDDELCQIRATMMHRFESVDTEDFEKIAASLEDRVMAVLALHIVNGDVTKEAYCEGRA